MSGLSLTKRTVPDIQYYLFEAGCKRFNSVGLSVEPGTIRMLISGTPAVRRPPKRFTVGSPM
ncbi:unnamed protein product, partial [Porites lobata]